MERNLKDHLAQPPGSIWPGSHWDSLEWWGLFRLFLCSCNLVKPVLVLDCSVFICLVAQCAPPLLISHLLLCNSCQLVGKEHTSIILEMDINAVILYSGRGKGTERHVSALYMSPFVFLCTSNDFLISGIALYCFITEEPKMIFVSLHF